MSDTLQSLRGKIDGIGELESVVRTMKALAASSIGQYERAVLALVDYYRTVELGLAAYLRKERTLAVSTPEGKPGAGEIGAVVFGSDQGLVGQFNEELADFAASKLRSLSGEPVVWVIGGRVASGLEESGVRIIGQFTAPNSVTAITPLVGQILIEVDSRREKGRIEQVYLFHNRPKSAALYEPVSQRLLPLDESWRRELDQIPWPSRNPPEVVCDGEPVLLALIREYLFVSLFKTCAESLASENACRLAAMQRAEKSIQDRSEDLTRVFQRLRQSSIDEELFDVVSGFDALSKKQVEGS